MRRVFWWFGILLGLFLMVPVWPNDKEFDKVNPTHVFIPAWTRSVQLYGQPHAIWLDQCHVVGANQEILKKTLDEAVTAKEVPEFVVYTIPYRDLGQSSEGGFKNDDDYIQDNHLNAILMYQFFKTTGLHPVVYLEPDSLPQAVQNQQEHPSAEAQRILQDRIRLTGLLITQYQQAGAKVYLSGAHSGWFDYGDDAIQRMASILNQAHLAQADGLVTNVSDRQPIMGTKTEPRSEFHYLSRLLPHLNLAHRRYPLDVRVDTSRNGGITQTRLYYLSANGQLFDNESQQGRLVGSWNKDASGEIAFIPFYGPPKTLSNLLQKEKYHFHADAHILEAPSWLDAVGDVQPGPIPTDKTPVAVSKIIKRYRYIKPPDDCDGALNYPPGASKHDINSQIALRQTNAVMLQPDVWNHRF